MSASTTIAPTELGEITERIRVRVQQWSGNVIAIGKDLIMVKGLLPHGDFQDWVADELGMTIRTAQNYMNTAKLVEAKGESISLLPPATIYMLASKTTPAEITDRVVADLEAGNRVNPCLVQEEVVKARRDARYAQIEEQINRKKERSPKANRRRQREIEKIQQDLEEQRRQREAAAKDAAVILIEHIPDDELDQLTDLLDSVQLHDLRTILLDRQHGGAP